MKVEIPFIGGNYDGRTKLSKQITQNLYVEIDKTGGKNVIALVNTPGLKLWKLIASGGTVRLGGLHVMGDYLYAIMGNTLYRIDSNKSMTTIGTISTSSGRVYMEDNGSYLVITDGAYGYYYDGSTITTITDSSFPTPKAMSYIDGYWLILKDGTDEVYYNPTADDPTAWDATYYFVAEGQGDKALTLITSNRLIRIFGEKSLELWYNSSSDFDRNPGGFLEVGCGSGDSVAEIEGTVLWLDDRNRVCQTVGLSYTPVSNKDIEYQISQLTDKSNAFGYCYNQDGHNFYVLTFPGDNKTFCYDITTTFWHTRASTVRDNRHRVNCVTLFDNKWLCGDMSDGSICEYDLDTYDERGFSVRRIRQAQSINKTGKLLFFRSFEIDFETGIGLSSGQGSDPQAILTYSVDDGKTFSNELWESIGVQGRYQDKVTWAQLGSGYSFIPKVVITDPVKVVMVNAFLNADEGLW